MNSLEPWLFPWEDLCDDEDDYFNEDVKGDSELNIGLITGEMFLSALKMEEYADKMDAAEQQRKYCYSLALFSTCSLRGP